MPHYRKIETKIWNDEKFMSLSNLAKLSFLFTLTHPNMTSLGAMRSTIEGLASELDVSLEVFREAFDKGMLKADQKAKLIYAPNFLKYNRPESPNVVKAWGGAYKMLPECPTKKAIFNQVFCITKQIDKSYKKGFAKGKPGGFVEVFKEAFAEDLAESVNSEQ
jgi:hypothetical protein